MLRLCNILETITELKEKTGNEMNEKVSPAGAEDEISPRKRPFWVVSLLGLAAGAGGGLLGVGGGIVMIPILTLWGNTQKCAQGTSLLVITLIAPIAIFRYAVHGNVDFHFSIPLAIGGLIGGEIGSRIALRFSNKFLGKAFAVLLILVALKMLFLPEPKQVEIVALGIRDLVRAGALGIGAGLAAGFFGVGGGIVFVPIGVLAGGLTQVVAQGSSWTAILPTSAICANRYRLKGEVAWRLVWWLALGAAIGVVFGSDIAAVLPSMYLQKAFALYLLYTGVSKLMLKKKAGVKSAMCNKD
jgi:uncharacterized protein